ncbi:hypothetical protein J2X68_007425 [Streptomyces sp. 3330]|uniref:hypothetical protein n=1 Tax=Streptomyces sp. 3330 TaxID=2817755 RepID=UPI00285BC21E|nr:hypothetical protein [Streptomyces sp. 3330]MDR6980683.1 hypothetical protein [Streptomyces sp. 3330]
MSGLDPGPRGILASTAAGQDRRAVVSGEVRFAVRGRCARRQRRPTAAVYGLLGLVTLLPSALRHITTPHSPCRPTDTPPALRAAAEVRVAAAVFVVQLTEGGLQAGRRGPGCRP